jgi:uncharacterized protein (DUF305 family)
MSSIVLGGELPAGVRSFALEVVSDQRYEIGLMEATLRTWGEPPADEDGRAMAWMGHSTAVEDMPGMASADDLDALADLEGDAAASRWLTLMTAHHEGGIEMAEAGQRDARDPFVRTLAGRIARNQRIEINEYAALRTRLDLGLS